MSSSYGSLWPGVPASANVVKSQNVYNTATTPLTVIGSGGGGGGPVPENLVVSTLSAFALSNISSINNAPYNGGGGSYPANALFSSITMADYTSGGGDAGIINMTNEDNTGYGSKIIFQHDSGAVNSTWLGYESSTSSLRIVSYLADNVANGNLYVERLQGVSSLNAYPIPSYPMAINASTLSLNVQTTDFTNNALVNVSTINGTNWSALVSTVAGLPR